ncbi:hypothetical protein [Dactylosporangium sp. CA-092794]|uniref:hypothetical protein n=1 Tax=Dactylosporangium sp. CA-092794 TaxID=3239929 RepID=UPI003D90D1A4
MLSGKLVVGKLALRLSSCLLLAAAVLTMVYAVSSVWLYYVRVDAYEDAVAAGAVGSGSFEGFGAVLSHGFAVLQFAVAAAMIGLARSNLRGSGPARTTTWWLGGVMLCFRR